MSNTNIHIVVHGTATNDGYNVLYSTSKQNIDTILCDIRTPLMQKENYKYKKGILLQVAPRGVWVSKIILLGDVERRRGFIAFSVYIPKGYRVDDLNIFLNGLENKYLDKIKDKEYGKVINLESWEFVDKIRDNLSLKSSITKKHITYTGCNKEKYVYVDSSEIDEKRFFKFLYQPEYANYGGVFWGNEILNESISPLEICLPKLDDFEYIVEWKGTKEGIPNKELPIWVLDSELEDTSITFSKDNYDSKTINLKSNGKINKDEESIVLTYPELEPHRKVIEIVKPKHDIRNKPTIKLLSSNDKKYYFYDYKFELKGAELGCDYNVEIDVPGYNSASREIKSEDLQKDNNPLTIFVKYTKTISIVHGKFDNVKIYENGNLIKDSKMVIEDSRLDYLVTLKTKVSIAWSFKPSEIDEINLTSLNRNNITIQNKDVDIPQHTPINQDPCLVNPLKFPNGTNENGENENKYDKKGKFAKKWIWLIVVFVVGLLFGGFGMWWFMNKQNQEKDSSEGYEVTSNENWQAIVDSTINDCNRYVDLSEDFMLVELNLKKDSIDSLMVQVEDSRENDTQLLLGTLRECKKKLEVAINVRTCVDNKWNTTGGEITLQGLISGGGLDCLSDERVKQIKWLSENKNWFSIPQDSISIKSWNHILTKSDYGKEEKPEKVGSKQNPSSSSKPSNGVAPQDSKNAKTSQSNINKSEEQQSQAIYDEIFNKIHEYEDLQDVIDQYKDKQEYSEIVEDLKVIQLKYNHHKKQFKATRNDSSNWAQFKQKVDASHL